MYNFRTIFALISLFSINILFGQTEVKKPAEAFDLYFKTFVNKKESSLKELNDYMRPTVEGKDMYSINFAEGASEMISSMSENFLSIFSPAAAKANKKEAEDYFAAMIKNFNEATYKITSVKLVDNEYIKGEKIAEISYRVTFKLPNESADEVMTAYKDKNPKSLKAEELKKLLVSLKNTYSNATKEESIDRQINLYQLKEKGKIYYNSGSIYEEIVTNLTDFYFGSDEEGEE